MPYPWPALRPSLLEWGVTLAPEGEAKLEGYLDQVAAANRKTNLTAAEGPDELLLRHAADGLAAVPVLKRLLPAAPRVADLGAGGGFIGFAVKAAWPEAEVTLIESLQRKYDFLNLAAVRWGGRGLRVMRWRAGSGAPPPGAAGFDAVLSRALAPLPESFALAWPLVRPGGLYAAFLSEPPPPGLANEGARVIELHRYRLPSEDRERVLAVFRKGD